VRPGVLIDQLEQALLSAEESRTKRDALRVPEAAGAPSGKPRTPLHPQPDREPAPPAEVAAAESGHDRWLWSAGQEASPPATGTSGGEPETGWRRPARSTDAQPMLPPGEVASPTPTPEEVAPSDARSALKREPQRLVSSKRESDDEGPEEPGEIDRVLLAKEFSGLLQVDKDPDEGSS
jgi:hypothetical protein